MSSKYIKAFGNYFNDDTHLNNISSSEDKSISIPEQSFSILNRKKNKTINGPTSVKKKKQNSLKKLLFNETINSLNKSSNEPKKNFNRKLLQTLDVKSEHNNHFKDFFVTCNQTENEGSQLIKTLKHEIKEVKKMKGPDTLNKYRENLNRSKEEINILKKEKIKLDKNYVVVDNLGKSKIFSGTKDNIFRQIDFINNITFKSAYEMKEAMYRKFGNFLKDEVEKVNLLNEFIKKSSIEQKGMKNKKIYQKNDFTIKKMLRQNFELKKKILRK
jgi:hypothetical protein